MFLVAVQVNRQPGPCTEPSVWNIILALPFTITDCWKVLFLNPLYNCMPEKLKSATLKSDSSHICQINNKGEVMDNLWYFFTPSNVRFASDRMLKRDIRLPRNGVKRHRPIDIGRSLGHPTVCLPEYLATFTRFRSHTRIIGKGTLFDFATVFTRRTAQVALDREATCSERIGGCQSGMI